MIAYNNFPRTPQNLGIVLYILSLTRLSQRQGLCNGDYDLFSKILQVSEFRMLDLSHMFLSPCKNIVNAIGS